MKKAYLIMELWVDWMENDWGAAQGRKPLKVFSSLDDANAYCKMRGHYIGTGYPFQKDEQIPFCEVVSLDFI